MSITMPTASLNVGTGNVGAASINGGMNNMSTLEALKALRQMIARGDLMLTPWQNQHAQEMAEQNFLQLLAQIDETLKEA